MPVLYALRSEAWSLKVGDSLSHFRKENQYHPHGPESPRANDIQNDNQIRPLALAISEIDRRVSFSFEESS